MSEEKAKYHVIAQYKEKLSWFQNQAFCLKYSDFGYKHPGPADVKSFIEISGWSHKKFANVVGVNYSDKKGSSTIRKWCSNLKLESYRKIPYSAWRLALVESGILKKTKQAWVK